LEEKSPPREVPAHAHPLTEAFGVALGEHVTEEREHGAEVCERASGKEVPGHAMKLVSINRSKP
jgi:hypothetical protein